MPEPFYVEGQSSFEIEVKTGNAAEIEGNLHIQGFLEFPIYVSG
jgi:hypothetical protein